MVALCSPQEESGFDTDLICKESGGLVSVLQSNLLCYCNYVEKVEKEIQRALEGFDGVQHLVESGIRRSPASTVSSHSMEQEASRVSFVL